MSDQPDAETPTWQHTQEQTCMPPAGFEPATPAIELPQAHTLEPATTGMANP